MPCQEASEAHSTSGIYIHFTSCRSPSILSILFGSRPFVHNPLVFPALFLLVRNRWNAPAFRVPFLRRLTRLDQILSIVREEKPKWPTSVSIVQGHIFNPPLCRFGTLP